MTHTPSDVSNPITPGSRRAAGTTATTTWTLPRVTFMGNDTALLDTKYETTMETGASALTLGGRMSLVLICTRAVWRILSGRS